MSFHEASPSVAGGALAICCACTLAASVWRCCHPIQNAMPPSKQAKPRNTTLGMPGITPSKNITSAVTPNTLGESNTWPTICWPKSSSLPTRETTIAAATEISSAGIWAASASPMASVM